MLMVVTVIQLPAVFGDGVDYYDSNGGGGGDCDGGGSDCGGSDCGDGSHR